MQKNFWFVVAIAVSLTTSSCTGGVRGGGERYPEIVPGGAIFYFEDRDARSVHLAGDFNNWSPTADPMSDANDDGTWSLFYSLMPGRYEYKFVVDGSRWVADPRNPDTAPDGFDGRNSIVRIPR